MPNGDQAAAAGMDIVPGTAKRSLGYDEINKTRDYIAQFFNSITLTWSAITGKPSTFPPSPHTHQANTLPTTGSNVQADIDYLNSRISAVDGGKVNRIGDTITGHLYLPNSSAATSGYTVAYINNDGRVSRGASSEQYKDDIQLIDPASLGEIFPGLYSFRMVGSDQVHVGWIAERLAEDPALLPFVVFKRDVELDENHQVRSAKIARDNAGNPIPESIDFIGLFIAQITQLHQRDQQRQLTLEQLLDRVTALEAR